MKGVAVILGITEEETGILTSIYIGWGKTLVLFFFNYLAHVFRQEVISDLFAKLVCLFFTPPGLLLYLLYQRDLAWGKNQAWVANNNFSRSHALLQKLKTVIANEAGIYLMLLHTTILSQSCRNADCKNIAFYAFNATQYENNAYFQKLDLGS